MTSGLQSLIFDLDGTLLDSKPGVLASFAAAAKSVFPHAALDLAQVPLGPPIRQICRAVFPAISAEETEQMARAFRSHYDSVGSAQSRLYEGAMEVLSAASSRNIRLDIATNKPLRVTTSILARLRISHFFQSVVAVDSTEPPFNGKAAMIRHVLEQNRLPAEDTIYVGDTAEDAAAARVCGIRFVWAAYGYGKLEGSEPVFKEINKLADLREILQY